MAERLEAGSEIYRTWTVQEARNWAMRGAGELSRAVVTLKALWPGSDANGRKVTVSYMHGRPVLEAPPSVSPPCRSSNAPQQGAPTECKLSILASSDHNDACLARKVYLARRENTYEVEILSPQEGVCSQELTACMATVLLNGEWEFASRQEMGDLDTKCALNQRSRVFTYTICLCHPPGGINRISKLKVSERASSPVFYPLFHFPRPSSLSISNLLADLNF